MAQDINKEYDSNLKYFSIYKGYFSTQEKDMINYYNNEINRSVNEKNKILNEVRINTSSNVKVGNEEFIKENMKGIIGVDQISSINVYFLKNSSSEILYETGYEVSITDDSINQIKQKLQYSPPYWNNAIPSLRDILRKMTIQYLNSDEVIRQYTKQINNIRNTNTTYKQNVNQIINAKKPGINKLEEARKREEAGASSENKDLYLAVRQPPVGKALLFHDQFFNIPNPSAPYVDVQFRTAYSEEYELDNPLIWESATTTKRNFFNQLSIEDTGLMKLNLSLIDMNFVEL